MEAHLMFGEESPLPITEVHGLLRKPKDLTREQFTLLNWYTNGKRYIIECSNTLTAAIETNIAESISDGRRFIKQGSLFVGKRQIKDFNDDLNVNEFFETGYDGVKWTSIRNGKKKSRPIIIIEDEVMFPNDPWFGKTYQDWKDEQL